MNAEFIGIICGATIGLIISVIVLTVCNRNKKVKTEYDERQKAIRGKSYMYGFYTAVIYMAALVLFYMTEIAIPFTIPVVMFFGIFLSISVLAVHSILNGAYWGLNNNKGRYIIVFCACALINLAVGISAMINGSILEGVQGPLINFLCGILCLEIGIAVLIKDHIGSKDEEEGED